MLAMVPFFLIGDPVAANIYWDICLGGIMAVALWFAWHLPERRAAWVLIVLGQFLFIAGDVTWSVSRTCSTATPIRTSVTCSTSAGTC